MSVRYVLTTVLPRYTMRRPNLASPPAPTLSAEPKTVDRVYAKWLRILADEDAKYARMMGHVE